MARSFNFRPKRKSDLSAAKYLYLTDQEYTFRLVTSPQNPPLSDRLDEYYKQLEALRSERTSSITMYATCFAACLLLRFNLLSKLDAGGITLLPIALKHVVLLAYSLAQLRMGIVLAKYSFIAGIFDQEFKRSAPHIRADLLSKYPLALDVLKYYIFQIGSLPYMATVRLPKRMIAMIFLLALGLVIYTGVAFWVVITLAIDVWYSDVGLPSLLSKATVAISGLIIVGSYCLPYERLIKRAHMHIGLVEMLNRAHQVDRPRYMRYWKWMQRIRQSDP